MNRFTRLRRCLLALSLVLCTAFSAQAAPSLNVVASFSILADMTQRIGGERIAVHSLVGRDADAHVFQPTPTDARKLAEAKLVVINGLGFEGWIERLVKSSGYRGKVVTATTGIATYRLEHEGHEQPPDDHEHQSNIDPHAWQSLSNAQRYVDNIERALSEVDPAGKAVYQANAAMYKQEMAALDQEVQQAFRALPKERRKVVTTHDAFGYFARAYGVEFVAPVGVNTEAEPSAADIGRIIKQIRREKIPAVFMETISDPRLLERIRQESGAKIGGSLYSDALSPSNGPAPTYLKMMRYNAQTLATALK